MLPPLKDTLKTYFCFNPWVSLLNSILYILDLVLYYCVQRNTETAFKFSPLLVIFMSPPFHCQNNRKILETFHHFFTFFWINASFSFIKMLSNRVYKDEDKLHLCVYKDTYIFNCTVATNFNFSFCKKIVFLFCLFNWIFKI